MFEVTGPFWELASLVHHSQEHVPAYREALNLPGGDVVAVALDLAATLNPYPSQIPPIKGNGFEEMFWVFGVPPGQIITDVPVTRYTNHYRANLKQRALKALEEYPEKYLPFEGEDSPYQEGMQRWDAIVRRHIKGESFVSESDGILPLIATGKFKILTLLKKSIVTNLHFQSNVKALLAYGDALQNLTDHPKKNFRTPHGYVYGYKPDSAYLRQLRWGREAEAHFTFLKDEYPTLWAELDQLFYPKIPKCLVY